MWDEGTLYWVDISGKAVYAKSDGGNEAVQYGLPFEPGALAVREGGGMILATSEGLFEFDLQTRRLLPLVNPEPENRQNHFNDGKCDPAGRFIAGTRNRERKALAALYLLEKGRPPRKIHGPVTCSNGLAWSADAATFYYIDTPTSQVHAFHYDLARGGLSNERVAIEIPPSHGKPDGMTIDTLGNLWIALFGGSAVECWNPGTGKQQARIEVPARNVTSCVFGGHRFGTLFITTARNGDKSSTTEDLGGSIFRADTGSRGFPAIRFRDSLAQDPSPS